MNLRPHLGSDLPESRTGRQNDALRVTGQPPKRGKCQRIGLAGTVASSYRGAPIGLNRAKYVSFALPELGPENMGREQHWVADDSSYICLLVGIKIAHF